MPNPVIQLPIGRQLAAGVFHWAQILRRLGRAELSAMVSLSALAGYLFAGGQWRPDALLVLSGIGLLATGSSALNQWQEQDLDARMERTCQRPLPEGLLTPVAALFIALASISAGLLLLSLLPSLLPLLLGSLAVIWYNGIYTPLKRRTAFAALPGAVCGALPPLIGWVAAGGDLLAAPALILAGTLFLWQIPHTWLLLCCYRQDLQRSGLPDLFQTIPTERLLRISNFWLGCLGLCFLLFPFFGFISSPTLSKLFIAGTCYFFFLIINANRTVKFPSKARRLFHLTNLSMALLLTTLILDSFFS